MHFVSIVVPCYNEETTIKLLLDALYLQSYPRENLEILIADGLSTDHTRTVIESFQVSHPDLTIHIIDNPKRNIPSGLNRALNTAKGSIIIRLDAHSIPEKDYAKRCVDALENNLGDNVGGVWKIQPRDSGWIARSIAAAAAHPLGVGDAQYRFTKKAQLVDTVPFGAFFKHLITKIGPFDETLLTNEDYEFNARIRKIGGRIWLDPLIKSTYFARGTLLELAQQYLRYGYWKAKMLQRHPDTLKWRQALPPILVLSIIGLFILGFIFTWAYWLLLLEIFLYSLILFAVGIQIAMKIKDPMIALGVPVAIATMHLCWGSALLWSLVFSRAND